MDILWLCVFAVLLVGYFALEGPGIGTGMLLPVLGRTPRDRDEIVMPYRTDVFWTQRRTDGPDQAPARSV